MTSALQRARSTATAALPKRSQQETLRALGDRAVADLAHRYATALETGDVDMDGLDEPARKAFMCYLFLATVQELIIQHLDSTILGP